MHSANNEYEQKPAKMESNNASRSENNVKIADPKKELDKMITQYLESRSTFRTDRKVEELEIRFGSKPGVSKPIGKIDYDNVVSKLYSVGFESAAANAEGLQMLRIQNEYTDIRTGQKKLSNIRAEITGVDLIQEYCRSNSIQKIMDMPSTISASSNKLKFTQKMPPIVGQSNADGKLMRMVDFDDFGFRVSYNLEQDFKPESNVARNIIDKWNDSKKVFRHINRVRFQHPDFPVFADLSIIKSSRKSGKVPIPQYTIQEANVYQGQEQYEIEMEIDNSKVGKFDEYNTTEKLLVAIRKCIRFVLGALQGTNYPIAYSEMNNTLQSYMKMLHGEEYQPRRVMQFDFVGPSSVTLQLENIIGENVLANVPNIRSNYTVTEKADGERRMLYVSENGRIYLIDTNMKVIFTGAMTNEKTIYNSLLDGEHIKFDKNHKFINLYAAFDIYFVNNISVRENPFILSDEQMEEFTNDPKNKGKPLKQARLLLLQKCIKLMKPISILDSAPTKNEDADKHNPCGFDVKCKEFYMDSPDMSIFQACSTILSNIDDGLFAYNTDGLIFTPSNVGVGYGVKKTVRRGQDKDVDRNVDRNVDKNSDLSGPLHKATWDKSLKWKPEESNTIDFLVSVKKDKTGKDETHYIFEDGKNTAGLQTVKQYKTLVLRCGFDERKDGYLNPMQDIIDGKVPPSEVAENEEMYKPVPFQPTNPYDPKACLCNITVYENGNGDLTMKTEENEYFEEDTIVEFRYDMTKEGAWRWIPLRVRYDKTGELRAGLRNYGNAYKVANSNWHSIHNPITKQMISSGTNIPEYSGDEDVYYNSNSTVESSTKPLRDFHNKYIKRKLIMSVSQRKDTMIDYAVGKAGDLSKWIQARLSFVFGIDISKDNINNHMDGACSRYLSLSKKERDIPSALFVVGNSSLNIRSGDAFTTEKEKNIANAVFGSGPKDRKLLGEGVYKSYGVGHEGFQISSCQFALHYFFENATTLHNFVRNLAECTRMGGYFVGTCYDGKEVFKLLKRRNEGEGFAFYKNEKKIYELTKRYNQTGFPDDEMSLGYKIDVFQETINKVFSEYLVNFEYFIRIMENYGFEVLPNKEADNMDLPHGTGLFDELYRYMDDEIYRHPSRESDYGIALEMSSNEKSISFMNRYFVFRKIRTVNAKKVAKSIMGDSDMADEIDEKASEKESEKASENVPVTVPGRKIKGKKMILEKFAGVTETESVGQIGPSIPSVLIGTNGPAGTKGPSVSDLGEMVTFKIKKNAKPKIKIIEQK